MYTPEELQFTPKQATFNFNNLPSHEKLFRLSVPRILVGRLNQIKETPATDPQQIPLENKVVNKIIAQSNQRCGHHSFKRKCLFYATIT
jgi:hypothetical protein